MMANYRWPGNVRQLKNTIERAVLMTTGSEILPEHLPPEIRGDGEPMMSKGADAILIQSSAVVPLEECERAESCTPSRCAGATRRKRRPSWECRGRPCGPRSASTGSSNPIRTAITTISGSRSVPGRPVREMKAQNSEPAEPGRPAGSRVSVVRARPSAGACSRS